MSMRGWFVRIREKFSQFGKRLGRTFRSSSLQRTIAVSMILLSLLPVVLVSVVTVLRARTQAEAIVANQMQNSAQNLVRQIDQFAKSRLKALGDIQTDSRFSPGVASLLDPDPNSPQSSLADFNLRFLLQSATSNVSGAVFDKLLVLRKNGELLVSSDDPWLRYYYPDKTETIPFLETLASKPTSGIYFDPFKPYQNQFVMVIARPVVLEGSTGSAVLVGLVSAPSFNQALTQLAGLFPGSRGYFIDANRTLVGFDTNKNFARLPVDQADLKGLFQFYQSSGRSTKISYVSFSREPVNAYALKFSELFGALVVEVPQQVIFNQFQFLDGITVMLLVLALAITSGASILGASRLVNPLLDLAQIARAYARRDFHQRSPLQREDEIGVLASSLNHMGEELSALYQNLEEKVEQRTSQLRTASEVAQLAISSTRIEDTLERTAALLAERFQYYHVAIYLLDDSGTRLVLREASGEIGEIRKRKDIRLPIDSQTFLGWVASYQQARVIADTSEDPLFSPDSLLPMTRSEAAFPIATGNQFLGILDVHSTHTDAFDTDSSFVLQTLANQIAGALQTMRLLQTTQIDLEETSLLYRITRQVSEASDPDGITRLIVENQAGFAHTNAFLTVAGANLHINGLYDRRSGKLERSLYTIEIPASKMIEALSRGQMIFVEDISQPSDYDNILAFFIRRNCKSAALFPSLSAGKLTRVIVLGFTEDERVDQTVLQPYQNLSSVIGAGLGRLLVLEELENRLSELQILASFSKAASAETSVEGLFQALHRQVEKSFGADLGIIVALYDEASQIIAFPYAYENAERLNIDPLPIGQGLTSLLLQRREPLLLVKDTERRAREMGARFSGKPARSWLGVPLLAGGDLVGALILQDQLREERFTEFDLGMFSTLAPQIATAIRNAQLVERLQSALIEYDQERLLLNTWLDNTPDSILIKDLDGRYQRFSRSFAVRQGLNPTQIAGKSDSDLFDPQQAEYLQQEHQAVIEKGTPQTAVIQEPDPKGQPQWFSVSRIPIRTVDGKIQGIMAIRRDITEFKKTEATAIRRSEALQIAAEIARDATNTLDIQDLLFKAVNLVRERFNFYHASIFLLDEIGEYAVLKESTGEAGAAMKANHHRLAVGSRSIVGQSTLQGRPVIVRDVTDDPTHLPNPLLPNTRAEMALPLMIGAQIIGALDVQSTQAGAFTEEDVNILSTMADQLSVALVRLRLYNRAQGMIGQQRVLQQMIARANSTANLTAALDSLTADLVSNGFAERVEIFLNENRDSLDLASVSGMDITRLNMTRFAFGEGIVGQAALTRSPQNWADIRNHSAFTPMTVSARSALALPILFGDDLLGVLYLESDQPARFDENIQEVMTALSNNLAGTIANTRLIVQVRRQVDRQKQIFEATSRIRRSTDLQTILQTSVTEIGKVLNARAARIELNREVLVSGNGQDDGKEAA